MISLFRMSFLKTTVTRFGALFGFLHMALADAVWHDDCGVRVLFSVFGLGFDKHCP